MPKVEQVGRAAEGAVMTEGCGMWPVQTGLRMTPFEGGLFSIKSMQNRGTFGAASTVGWGWCGD